MSNKAPMLNVDYTKWLQTLRNITNATNDRTVVSGHVPISGLGNSASLLNFKRRRAIASALVLANMNSLPLDWAARLSVGGSNMNFYIVKQLPVLPPEAYLENPKLSLLTYAEMITPRVLELTYTAYDVEGFAKDLGYEGPPFAWDDGRRHHLQCELDAIYAHMYHLDLSDLEWILDPSPPSSSFPALKRNELAKYGEYRTKRYVLQAFDQLERGVTPDLVSISE